MSDLLHRARRNGTRWRATTDRASAVLAANSSSTSRRSRVPRSRRWFEPRKALCARIYRRRDGRMLTADCPVGQRAKRRRNLVALMAAGLGLAMASASGALGPFGARCAKSWSSRLGALWGRASTPEPHAMAWSCWIPTSDRASHGKQLGPPQVFRLLAYPRAAPVTASQCTFIGGRPSGLHLTWRKVQLALGHLFGPG
jgi:hypothetical protein